MPRPILPPLPSSLGRVPSQTARLAQAVVELETQEPGADAPLADLFKWAQSGKADPAAVNRRLQDAFSPKRNQAWWQKALEAVSLPFDAFAESLNALIAGVAPTPAPFERRGAVSRETLRRMFRGEVTPAEAAGELRETFRERSTAEQVITGLLFDPFNLIPGYVGVKAGIRGGVLAGVRAGIRTAVPGAGFVLPERAFAATRITGVSRKGLKVLLFSSEKPAGADIVIKDIKTQRQQIEAVADWLGKEFDAPGMTFAEKPITKVEAGWRIDMEFDTAAQAKAAQAQWEASLKGQAVLEEAVTARPPTAVPPTANEGVLLAEKWGAAKARNSVKATQDLEDLKAKGYATEDAEAALQEYKDTVRADFEDATEFAEARSEAWDNFVQELDNTELPEVLAEAPPTAVPAEVVPPAMLPPGRGPAMLGPGGRDWDGIVQDWFPSVKQVPARRNETLRRVLDKVAARGPAWERLTRVFQQAFEILAGRGALASDAGMVTLRRRALGPMNESTSTAVRDVWNRDFFSRNFTIENEVFITPSESVRRINDDWIGPITADLPGTYSDVDAMRHGHTIFDWADADSLPRYFDATRGQVETVEEARRLIAAAERHADTRIRVASNGKLTLDDFKKGERISPYYFHHAKEGDVVKVQAGRAMRQVPSLRERDIHYAGEQLRRGIPYKSVPASMQRYIYGIMEVAADVEMVEDLHPFAKTMAQLIPDSAKLGLVDQLTALHRAARKGEALPDKGVIDALRENYGEVVDDILKNPADATESVQKAWDEASELRRQVHRLKEIQPSERRLPIFAKLRGEDEFFSLRDAQTINDWLLEGQENLLAVTRGANQVTNMVRMLRSGLDVSWLLIHGFIPMLWQPQAWGRAAWKTVGTVTKSQAVRDAIVAEQQLRAVRTGYIKAGGVLGEMDVFRALETPTGFERRFRRLPLLSQAETTFTVFLNEMRLNMWEGLSVLAKTDLERAQVISVIGRTTGAFNPVLMGMPQLQRQLESSLIFFAPSYRRASYALMLSIMRGDLEGKLARQALMRLLAAGAAFGALAQVTGNNDKVWNWASPRFMAARVPGTDAYVGIGTAFYGLARLMGNIHKTATTEPRNLLQWWDVRDNPMAKFLRSQAPPFPSAAIDALTGETFIGEPLRGRDGFIGAKALPHFALQTFPFWAENWLSAKTAEGNAQFMMMAGELMGGRAFPVSHFVQRSQLRQHHIDTDTRFAAFKGKQWRDLPVLEQSRLTQAHEDLQELDAKIVEFQIKFGRSLESDLALYMQKLQQNRSVVDTALAGYGRAFESGAITGQNFRELVRQQGAVLRGLQQKTATDFPHVIAELQDIKLRRKGPPEATFLGDHLFDEYMRNIILNEENLDANGIFQPDRFDKRDQSFRMTYGESVYRYVKERLKSKRALPPAVEELREAQDALRPYWNLHKTLFSDEVADAVDNWRALPQRERDDWLRAFPWLKQPLQRLEDARQSWRKTHPEMDWLLVKFYDNAPLTTLAEQRLSQWRAGR